jgi:hypothetical protein
MKVYCKSCEKPTQHRQKLHDIVCNKCDICNYPIFLQRLGDGRSNVAKRLVWVEWTEGGRGKAVHTEPQVGFSLCLGPYTINSENGGSPLASGYDWMTTEVTEIVEDKKSNEYRKIRFKTKNSEYVLHMTDIKTD